MAGASASLRQHWPEYLMEAWGLGTFMVSAGMFATLLEYPGSPVHQAIPDPLVRLVLMGLAMGLTAMAIIYSPWGQTSGAHINPAVTLTFLRLGKVARWDALFYIVAQFLGAALGIALAAWLLGGYFTQPPVAYAVTVPGRWGLPAAVAVEFLMALLLMLTVLFVSNTASTERLTGLTAGILVAIFITLAAPVSGMSINPARTFGSAVNSGVWTHVWIYFTAPVLGMLTAVELYRLLRPEPRVNCAKLDHPAYRRCIHCGYDPHRHDHAAVRVTASASSTE
jgi:aquaporin Z